MTSSLRDRAAMLIATWFGCGYFPKGPGTAGAAGALLIACLLVRYADATAWSIGLLGVLFCVPGAWAAGRTAQILGRKDPGLVVVDEVVGLWITMAGATALNWRSWLLGFLLFRVFDIWKPYPVRRLEALPGGTGIIADDAMAGAYGALVLLLAGWCNLY